MKSAMISPEILNKIWNDWLDQQELTNYERNFVLGKPYGCGGRRSNKKERFETWLFINGGSIRRINKQFHIEFTDTSQASFFLLRYS